MSLIENRLWRLMLYHFEDTRIVAESLVTTIRHSEQRVSPFLGCEVQSQVGNLFGRRLVVEPDVVIPQLMLEHKIYKLLL